MGTPIPFFRSSECGEGVKTLVQNRQFVGFRLGASLSQVVTQVCHKFGLKDSDQFFDTKKPPERTLEGTGKAFAGTGVAVHTYATGVITRQRISFISI
jgi:hypothetical protein